MEITQLNELEKVTVAKSESQNNFAFITSYLLGVEEQIINEFFPTQTALFIDTDILKKASEIEYIRNLMLNLRATIYKIVTDSKKEVSNFENFILELALYTEEEALESFVPSTANGDRFTNIKHMKYVMLYVLQRKMADQYIENELDDLVKTLKIIGFPDTKEYLKAILQTPEVTLNYIQNLNIDVRRAQHNKRSLINSVYGVTFFNEKSETVEFNTELSLSSENFLLTDRNCENLYNKLTGKTIKLETFILHGIEYNSNKLMFNNYTDGIFTPQYLQQRHEKYKVGTKDITKTGYKKRQTYLEEIEMIIKKEENLINKKRLQKKKEEEKLARQLRKAEREAEKERQRIEKENELKEKERREEESRLEAIRKIEERKKAEKEREKLLYEESQAKKLQSIENEEKPEEVEKEQLKEQKPAITVEKEEEVENKETESDNECEEDSQNTSSEKITKSLRILNDADDENIPQVLYRLADNEVSSYSSAFNKENTYKNRLLLDKMKSKLQSSNTKTQITNNTMVFVDGDNIGVLRTYHLLASFKENNVRPTIKIYTDKYNYNAFVLLKMIVSTDFNIELVNVERIVSSKSVVDTVLSYDIIEEIFKQKYNEVEKKKISIVSSDSDFYGLLQKNKEIILMCSETSTSNNYLTKLAEDENYIVEETCSDYEIVYNKYIKRLYDNIILLVLSRTPMIYWHKESIIEFSTDNSKNNIYGDVFSTETMRKLFEKYLTDNFEEILKTVNISFSGERTISINNIEREFNPNPHL